MISVDQVYLQTREIADVLLMTKAKTPIVSEIEVKISKADLERDKKKKKHKLYAEPGRHECPHKFYFCVPADLKDIALTWVNEVNPKYGVIIFKPEEIAVNNRLLIIKQASMLHKNNGQRWMMMFLKRLSSAHASEKIGHLNYEN